ncbi:MAG: L,D-transpeptidase [Desulfitobacterium hafniense]|nr:L,D-transpeptidase [Desulfitobacterium hafniense]
MSRHQIVIHKSRKQLELYEGNRLIGRYPIAIGKRDTPTPIGHFSIVSKEPNPGGIFGSHWLGLSIPHYGIHGTNNPASIGQSVSKGCIRLHNQDIARLYREVEVGTPVIIQP